MFTTQVHGAIRSDIKQVVPEEDEAYRDCTYGTRTVVAAAEEANPLNALSVGAIYSEDVVVSAMFVDMMFQVCGARDRISGREWRECERLRREIRIGARQDTYNIRRHSST